jgi:hypothetical protein
MELLLGSHVREQGHRVGRLAGFELEPDRLRIRRIIFSADGDLGPQAHTRSLNAVSSVLDAGDIALAPTENASLPAVRDVVLLGRATRVYRGGRDASRLAGVDVNLSDGVLAAAIGRSHWWSRRFSLPANTIDWSTPGEIRQRSDHRAA